MDERGVQHGGSFYDDEVVFVNYARHRNWSANPNSVMEEPAHSAVPHARQREDLIIIPPREPEMDHATFSLNCDLALREYDLQEKYLAVLAAQKVEISNEVVALDLQETSRWQREQAWRLMALRQAVDAPTMDALWHELLAVRSELATRAGEADYLSYRRQRLRRRDYSLDDCRRFHYAIEEWVTPVVLRRHEERRQQLGVKRLRPWDLDIDPGELWPLPDLQPQMDMVESMPTYECLELREFAGISAELLTVDHPPVAEAHAPQDTNPAGRQLETVLLRWPVAAMLDAFELWSYSNPQPAIDSAAREAQWRGLWLRFLPGVDWTDLEEILQHEWQRYHPLVLSPLSSIATATAQVGAVQLWIETRDDPASAMARLDAARSLGGSALRAPTLAEQYVTAGLSFDLSEHALREAVDQIEEALARTPKS